jgi:hypothetical protein
MNTNFRFDALDQIDFLKADCNKLIADMFALCPVDANGEHPSAFRMIATPFLYAVWERCFCTSFGIMTMVVSHQHTTPAAMSPNQAALWLQKEPFLNSFFDKIRKRTPELDQGNNRKIVTQSAYNALVDFVKNLLHWHSGQIKNTQNDGDLVMTFSNVNGTVLDLNAEAIGLAQLPEFINFRRKVGRLDDLVGRRNDISHGTMARPPGHREFDDLSNLVRDILIKEYCEVIQTWIIYR